MADKKTFEEILKNEGRLIYTNVGDSMWPLIRQGRDLLVIERAAGKPGKYVIPLYRRDSGQYVLHRILRVREQDYIICGDNRWHRETGITDQHILGVLTAIIRNGQEIPLNGWKYRLYLFFWCDCFPVRVLIIRGRNVVKRLIRRQSKKTRTGRNVRL